MSRHGYALFGFFGFFGGPDPPPGFNASEELSGSGVGDAGMLGLPAGFAESPEVCGRDDGSDARWFMRRRAAIPGPPEHSSFMAALGPYWTLIGFSGTRVLAVAL
jgi:hypothetical protein